LLTVALVETLGPRAVVVVSACSTFAGALLLFLSPVRRADAEIAVDPAETLTHTHIVEAAEKP
jgi:hypothetical protein